MGAEEQRTGNVRRLYRSRSDKRIAGVCGGVAEYLEIDPTVVRILWFLSFFAFGIGLLTYIAAIIIVPLNPHQRETQSEPAGRESRSAPREPRSMDWNLIVGIVFLVFGLLLIMRQLDYFHFGWVSFNFLPWRLIWPVALIGLGVFLIASGARIQEVVGKARDGVRHSRFRRSRSDKMVFGVCGGLAHSFDVDPTVMRILWVVGTIVTSGLGMLVYIVLALLLPEEDGQPEPTESPSSTAGQTGNSNG